MAGNRRLQAEVDRVLKKIQEGIVEFQSIWEKYESATAQNLKEKYESDLKKEIKKLQRHRESIKSWVSSGEIKNKKPLTDARRNIEIEMERFKVLEKEAKTKAYSKEGLMAAMKKSNSKNNRIDDDVAVWLREKIDEFRSKLDEFEESIENIKEEGLTQNKKNNTAVQDQLDELQTFVEQHTFHMEKLEYALDLYLKNEIVDDQIIELQEGVQYYLDSYQEPDFFYDENLYDVLDESPEQVELRRQKKEVIEDMEEDNNDDNNVATTTVTTNTTNTNNNNVTTPTVNNNDDNNDANDNNNDNNNDINQITKELSKSQIVSNNTKAVQNNNVIKATSTVTQPSSTISQPQQVQQPQQQPQQQQQVVQPVQQTVNKPLKPYASTAANLTIAQIVATNKNNTYSNISTPVNSNTSNNIYDNAIENVLNSFIVTPNATSISSVPSSYTLSYNNYSYAPTFSYFPTSVHPRCNYVLTAAFIEASVRCVVDSVYNERPPIHQITNTMAKNQIYFPQQPHRLLSRPGLPERVDEEILFYAFYFQPGTQNQYAAIKELNRRGWSFLKNNKQWFKRAAPPKEINVTGEKGAYYAFNQSPDKWRLEKIHIGLEYNQLEGDINGL